MEPIMELARMVCVSDVRRILKHISEVQFPDDGPPSEPTQSGVSEEDVTTASESNNSQFIRLLRDLEISPSLIQRLKDLRDYASKPEEFYASLSSEQWVRTVVSTDPKSMGVRSPDGLPVSGRDYAIQSNVVPCQPYGKKLKRARSSEDNEGGATSSGVYFPSSSLGLQSTREPRPEQECSILRDWLKKYKNELEMIGQTVMNEKRPFRREIKPSVEDRRRSSDLKASSSKDQDERFRVEFWNGGRFGVKVFTQTEQEIFFKEVEVIEKIGTHPHIVHSFGVSEPEWNDGYKYWMELLDWDLYDFISEWRDGGKDGKVPFPTPLDSMGVLLQIAKAMKHLHELNVIHGDLKSANIVISHYEFPGSSRVYIVKVIDFDRAKIIESANEIVQISGTCEYRAPEAWEDHPITKGILCRSCAKKCEVYSFGIVAVEVLAGVLVGKNSDLEKAKLDLWKDRRDHIMKLLEPLEIHNSHRDLIDLVKRCLDHDASSRPESFKDVTEELTSLIDAED